MYHLLSNWKFLCRDAICRVTGYTYTFIPDGDTYTLELVYECGTPGRRYHNARFTKRDYTFYWTCTADGDVYTLDTPEHFHNGTGETWQVSFAATSGEGGAGFLGTKRTLQLMRPIQTMTTTTDWLVADILAAFQPQSNRKRRCFKLLRK